MLPFEARHGNGQAMADHFVTEFLGYGFTVVADQSVTSPLGLACASTLRGSMAFGIRRGWK